MDVTRTQVPIDQAMKARIVRVSRAMSAVLPQWQRMSRAGLNRALMERGLEVVEAELGLAEAQTDAPPAEHG